MSWGSAHPAAIITALLLVGVVCSPLRAAEYRPPAGFNGHTWGEPLSAFHGLELWHAHEVLMSPGKVIDPKINCTLVFRAVSSLRPADQFFECHSDAQVEGDGSFAIGEYYFSQDRNPWVAQRVELVTISYLFCAGWQGDYLPKDVKKRLTLCGARVTFRSDTQAQLARREADYRSNFDRILRALIAEHGEPPGYEHSGRITIEAGDERVTTPEQPRPEYFRYRWCGVGEFARELRPACASTVTLVFEAARGQGTILYATPPMYDYAYGRHVEGQENDELYVLLNGRRLDRKYRYESHLSQCTGTHLCGPSTSSMPAAELSAFQP